MLAASSLSIWISNTATNLILLPIALAVLDSMKTEKAQPNPLAAPLMLGIAYAASIGGLGSPIGTPPDLVFIEQYAQFSNDDTVSFLEWMSYGVPVVFFMIPVIWIWIWIWRNQSAKLSIDLPKSGSWTPA